MSWDYRTTARTQDEAARAYNKKIVELRGEWAWVNPVSEKAA
jgi:hypothetical protein